MINLNKKYRLRAVDEEIELLKVIKNKVIGYRVIDSGEAIPMAWDSMNGLHDYGDRKLDLVEISRFFDSDQSKFKIDDRVLVSMDGLEWVPRYFAGADHQGALTFGNGSTSWSSVRCGVVGRTESWTYCIHGDAQ